MNNGSSKKNNNIIFIILHFILYKGTVIQNNQPMDILAWSISNFMFVLKTLIYNFSNAACISTLNGRRRCKLSSPRTFYLISDTAPVMLSCSTVCKIMYLFTRSVWTCWMALEHEVNCIWASRRLYKSIMITFY